MKELKVVGQFLAAIVYTFLFAGLIYMIMVFPLAWFLSLNTKTMIIVGIFLGGIIETVLFGLQFILMIPYAWIVKKNIVALIVSIGLLLFFLIRADVLVWGTTSHCGTEGVIVAIIITLMILQALGMTIYALAGMYSEEI